MSIDNTCNSGVKTACPVMIRPAPSTINVTHLLMRIVNVYVRTRWNADRPFLMQATIPPRPGSVRTRRGGFGDVRRGRDGDVHLRLAQGRRVIGAVAAHADRVALALERFDEPKLLLGKDPGVDGEVVRPGAFGNVVGGQTGPGSPISRAIVAAVATAPRLRWINETCFASWQTTSRSASGYPPMPTDGG